MNLVYNNKKYNLVRKDGTYVFDTWFKEINIGESNFILISNDSLKCNFFNKQTENFISPIWFDSVSHFRYNDNFSCVFLKNKGYNHINKNGKIISNMWYDNIYAFYKNKLALIYIKNKGWNFINTHGKTLLPFYFESIGSDKQYYYQHDICIINLNNKQNAINIDGNLISNIWFDKIYTFNNGYACVDLKGKSNYINKNGNLLLDFWVDNMYKFNKNYGFIEVNNNWFSVDVCGNVKHCINPPQ